MTLHGYGNPYINTSLYDREPTIVQQPFKCDLCGSTAVDHTEADCKRNRETAANSGITPEHLRNLGNTV